MKKILLLLIMAISTMILNGQNSDFLKMLENGIQAPSGHNTQPWKFKINNKNIEVYPNLEKELPIVDANHRELFISLGCAVENICITANQLGYNYQIEIINQENIPFIRIELNKGEIKKNPLFQQINQRQTNRSVYNSKIIKEEILNQLKNLNISSPISIFFYKKGENEFSTLSKLIYKGNQILFNNNEFKEELLEWIRFNSKEVEETKNGLAYDVLDSPSLPRWLGKPIVKSFLKPKSQNKSEKEKLNSSSHLVLITTKENTPDNWILAGQALERFLLKCTELEIAVAFSNQPCEVKELSNELRQKIEVNNNYPMLLMRIGYAGKMPYSKREPLKEVIIK